LTMWFVYICTKQDKLYTGITTDLSNRLRQHGRARLIHKESYAERDLAVHRERQIKGWSRDKKLAIANSGLVSLP